MYASCDRVAVFLILKSAIGPDEIFEGIVALARQMTGLLFSL
jgi:hypothetical protein